MTDIVERLRDWPHPDDAWQPLMNKAADEIERLRAELRDAYAQVDHLREEFDRLERAYKQLRETYLTSAAL